MQNGASQVSQVKSHTRSLEKIILPTHFCDYFCSFSNNTSLQCLQHSFSFFLFFFFGGGEGDICMDWFFFSCSNAVLIFHGNSQFYKQVWSLKLNCGVYIRTCPPRCLVPFSCDYIVWSWQLCPQVMGAAWCSHKSVECCCTDTNTKQWLS